MKQLLFALGVLAAQVAPIVPASRADAMALPTPVGIPAMGGDAALNAKAWAPLRHHWGYYRRRWPPECVVGWEHHYWWGHRYSCYHSSIKRHVHFDRHAGPH